MFCSFLFHLTRSDPATHACPSHIYFRVSASTQEEDKGSALFLTKSVCTKRAHSFVIV